MPTVSVVIPTYNQPLLLAETLASVAAQAFDGYEIVVVDDGSTDDTPAVLREFQKRLGSRLRVVTQANAGIGAARNRGIEESRGRYVALLDHDDLWRPGKLATQVAFMEAHPQCAACSVPYAYSTDPARCVYDVAAVRDADGIVRRPLRALARGEVFLISSSILFDRSRAAGLRYETRRQCIEDTPFQVGLFARGAFGIAGDEVLMVYRWHAANYSKQASYTYNGIRMLREHHRAGRFEELGPTDRADLEHFLAHVGRNAAVQQLMGGRRLRGLVAYGREWAHQARDWRFKFLLTYPLLLLTPAAVLRRRWGEAVR